MHTPDGHQQPALPLPNWNKRDRLLGDQAAAESKSLILTIFVIDYWNNWNVWFGFERLAA